MDKNTPGWNDPPMMTCHVPDATKPRNLLNKRVAYPLTSTCKDDSPRQNYSAALPPPTSKPNILHDIDKEVPEREQFFSEIPESINNVIESIENDGKKTEIVKRIDVMKQMWEEGELNAEIHEKIWKFFESIKNNDVDEANGIYMSLASTALCIPWIIALKYIIHSQKNKES